MPCSLMLNVRRVRSTSAASQSTFRAVEVEPFPHDQYRPTTMCEDCSYAEYGGHSDGTSNTCDGIEDVEPLLDTLHAEDTIASAADYVSLVKKWQARRLESGASFLVLHCTLLGQEAQILRQRFCFKRDTTVHIVYSDVRDGDAVPGTGLDLDASPLKETWRVDMKEKTKTITDPTIVFLGNNILLNGKSFHDFTLDDILIMYVPTIFAEFYSHSLSALMNSLHTFTPFLDGRKSSKVMAPAPVCCLSNAVTHSQRKRSISSEPDQVLYDSANLVTTQLYNGVSSHFGPHICQALEDRISKTLNHELRIGLEDETVPFHNLYVARGGEVHLRRGMGTDSSAFEIVCWTAFGVPEGGEFVVPGLLYKFDTGQGSTILFRPNRFYHATLPPEKRDLVNEKFAVALLS